MSSPCSFAGKGNREYLQTHVLPLLRHGLQELLEQVQKDRLKLVAGLDWDYDGHLPQGWKPFNPCRWLGEWLREKNHKDSGHGVQPIGRGIAQFTTGRDSNLESVFMRLANGQGHLELDTMLGVVGNHDTKNDIRKAEALHCFLDLDGDGHVSMDDFRQTMAFMMCGMADDECERLLSCFGYNSHLAHCQTREEKVKFLFDSIDSDGSDSLSANELMRLAHKIDPKATADKIDNTMAFLDDGNPGEVGSAEFVKRLMGMLGRIKDEDLFDEKLSLMLQATPPGTPRAVDSIQPSKFRTLVEALPTHTEARQVDCTAIMRMMEGDPDMLVLIDVRSKEERDVSTIEEAVTIDLVKDARQPFGYGVKAEDVQELSALFEDLEVGAMGGYSDDDEGQPIAITFCNTGFRGGAAAVALTAALSRDVFNICGGLIQYYNMGGTMIDPSGDAVEKLHPGSKNLAGYITRKNKIKVADITVDFGNCPV